MIHTRYPKHKLSFMPGLVHTCGFNIKNEVLSCNVHTVHYIYFQKMGCVFYYAYYSKCYFISRVAVVRET